MIFVHFGLVWAPPEPSGASLAHSVSRGCSFLENWVSKGALGAPLGHSLGSLCSHLRTLWQHMFGMPAFMGIRGGIWAPNGVKVTSWHPVLCAITMLKTDVSTTRHFFGEFVPKSCPKGSQGHLLVPFWAHFVSRCRLFGVPRGSCGAPGGPLWI